MSAHDQRRRRGTAKVSPYLPSTPTTIAASPSPAAMPSTAPISAVITLSWRTIRRTWRRVMPSARSVPSSRMRSKVESTSVLTMPNSDTITASASSTQRIAEDRADPGRLVVDEAGLGLDLGVREGGQRLVERRAAAVDEREPVALRCLERRSNAASEIVIGPRQSGVEHRRVLDRRAPQRQLLALARGVTRERGRRPEVVLGRPALVDQRAVGAELRRRPRRRPTCSRSEQLVIVAGSTR